MDVVLLASGKSTVHRPVRLSRGPRRTCSLFLFVISTVVFVKVALQSLSQSCPIDSRFPVLRPSKTLALLAISGRFGIASRVLVVEVIYWPFGHPTSSLVDGIVCMDFVFITYVPLAPESGCALIYWVGWATRRGFDFFMFGLVTLFFTIAAYEARSRPSFQLAGGHPALLPPNFLSSVACLRCPGFGLGQVIPV